MCVHVRGYGGVDGQVDKIVPRQTDRQTDNYAQDPGLGTLSIIEKQSFWLRRKSFVLTIPTKLWMWSEGFISTMITSVTLWDIYTCLFLYRLYC